MPARPKSICRHPGCGKLTDGPGYCQAHLKTEQQRKAEHDARRGNASARGYTWKWREARAAFLSEHPLCREHERRGELAAATVVDHIKPHRGDMALFWSRSNWQPLCAACHSAKTAREDGGFGNTKKTNLGSAPTQPRF